MALEKVERLLELLHGPVKRRSQEEYSEIPRMARIENADSNAVLAGLVSFHAAKIVVPDGCCASWCFLGAHKS
jgi:hypothetical protein